MSSEGNNQLTMNQDANNQASAMARAAQQGQQQLQNAGPTQGFQMNSSQMAAMLQQQRQGNANGNPEQLQQQPQGNGFDISNEIKRIQQLHQMGNGSGAQNNALLGMNAGDPSAFFQSMMEQQKVQAPRFDNPLAQGMGGANPLFPHSGFLQDARFLMAQNAQLSAAQLQRQNEVPLPSPHSLFHRDGSRRMRGGVIEPFPEKLHRLLVEVEAAGRSDVISFVANGRAFSIHKPDKFFKEIVPLYFRQSRLSSFKRQLNLYGFELINSGPARGGYFHELFVKDQPDLCRRMRRVAVKVGSSKETAKAAKAPGTEEAKEKVEGSETPAEVVDKSADI